MTEYNLDFFEAMEALKQGKIVEVSFEKRPMQIINGNLTYLNSNSPFCFTQTDIAAKWRIVEQKCWLDENYPTSEYDLTHGSIKRFAHEAIKRIEKNADGECSGCRESVQILREMIGEK